MKKFIIILDGPMGAGKSTIGDLIHKKLKRTALVNNDRIKWFISDFRRNKKDNAISRKVLLQMCDAYLQQGINLVIPQPFTKNKVPLRPYVNLAKKHKAELHVFHLDAPKDVLLKRIKNRQTGKDVRLPLAQSRVLRNIRVWKKERISVGKRVETDKATKGKIAKEILKEIGVK